MASLQERKNGWWQARVRRHGQPDQSRTFRTKTEATKWATEVEAEMNKGMFVSARESERTTFADLAERFRTEFAPHHYKAREDGKEAWRFQLDRLEEFFGEYALAAIDQKLVARYRDGRRRPREGSKRKAVGESTVRKELFMLSKVLEFGQREGGITLPRGNPVDHVRKPAEGRARDRRLSAEEWAKLESECRRSRNRLLWPAVQLALETAMRQGELLGLQWQDIDRTRRVALLADTKNGEARGAPLTTGALRVLEALPRSLRGPVIPVERLTLYHAFIAACKRAGISDYTWHDLRHEALSRFAERGDLSLLELAEISGHKTLQMLKRYTHLQAEKLARKLG
jgi:integrase